jgi:ABC-type glycerol-3-phosphate transport system substrate-binding protein
MAIAPDQLMEVEMQRLYHKITTIMMILAAAAVLAACAAATPKATSDGGGQTTSDAFQKAFPKFGGN